MTTAINLAGPDDADRLLALMARCHDELAQPYDDDHRKAMALPLLEGSPLGAVWMIGPARAPLGYVVVTFGWSVPLGGMVGWVAEVYIRASVRKRGIGTEVLHSVGVSLRDAGVKALHADVPAEVETLGRFFHKTGFRSAAPIALMTDIL